MFRYLTADMLGIEPHTRIDTGLLVDMLTKAKVIPDKKTLKMKNQGYTEFSTNITILDIGIRTNLYKLFKV